MILIEFAGQWLPAPWDAFAAGAACLFLFLAGFDVMEWLYGKLRGGPANCAGCDDLGVDAVVRNVGPHAETQAWHASCLLECTSRIPAYVGRWAQLRKQLRQLPDVPELPTGR